MCDRPYLLRLPTCISISIQPAMMIRIAAGAVLLLLPAVARGQDTVPVDDNSTGTTIELTTSNCNCTGCPNSDRVAVGLQKDLVSPACPEGSVATVTTLRTADTKGELSKYDLLTWNEVRHRCPYGRTQFLYLPHCISYHCCRIHVSLGSHLGRFFHQPSLHLSASQRD